MSNFWLRVKEYLKNTDLYLLIISVAATSFGIVLIYSATYNSDPKRYIIVQSAAFVIGLAGFIIASLIDVEHIAPLWKVFFIFNILLIASLIIFGVDGGTGNKSWLRFGSIGIQPGEIGKILFIFTLAQHISLLKDKISSFLSLLQVCVHICIVAGFLYVVSKDMGMSLAYVLIGISMLFAAGLSLKWFAAGAAVAAALVPLVWNFLGEFQRNRILVVIDPTVDAKTAWQAEQSKIAIGAGQLTGKGFLQGNQTQLSRLPAKHTDCIFAVAGEEFGFFGCAVIIIILSVLILRIFYVAWRADTAFSRLICVGIGSMLLFQTVINIGMCVGLTPVIGLTLPFFSYGGSSIVTMFICTGIVAGIRMRLKPSWLR